MKPQFQTIRILTSIGIALCLSACKTTSQGAGERPSATTTSQETAHDSGIVGTATYQAGCGTIPVDPPADYCAPTPFASTFELLRCHSAGTDCDFIKTFESDSEGKFLLLIQPGEYLIQLPKVDATTGVGGFFPEAAPIQVEVAPHQMTEATIAVRSSIPAP